MRDAQSVITDAVKDVKKLANVLELSESRTYEILSKDNPYPKSKKLIRDITTSQGTDSARLIKADMDALFRELLGEDDRQIDIIKLHRESSDVVQSFLEQKPVAEKMRELRELISVAQNALTSLEKDEVRQEFSRVN